MLSLAPPLPRPSSARHNKTSTYQGEKNIERPTGTARNNAILGTTHKSVNAKVPGKRRRRRNLPTIALLRLTCYTMNRWSHYLGGDVPVKYRKLGRTDIEVPAICMGCWAIAGGAVWGPQNEQDALDAVAASIDAGANFFDTAPGYGSGESEELLGRALKGRRNDAVIATKLSTSDARKSDAIRACEDSLRRLQCEHIDLYQIHWPNRDVPFDETADALQTLADQGKIRAIGVSNFGPQDLPEFCELLHAEVDQVAYNLLFRAAEFELLPVCADNDVSVLTYASIAEGLLAGKFTSPDAVPTGRARTRHFSRDCEQTRHDDPGAEAETFAAIGRVREIADGLGLPMAQLALAWLIGQQAVTSVIVGARNPQQAMQNAAAADIDLADSVVDDLNAATAALKDALGPNLDLWQSDSRIR
jgi:aryl-alcohol dehydrogenase-like predicted oxidoreductase